MTCARALRLHHGHVLRAASAFAKAVIRRAAVAAARTPRVDEQLGGKIAGDTHKKIASMSTSRHCQPQGGRNVNT